MASYNPAYDRYGSSYNNSDANDDGDDDDLDTLPYPEELPRSDFLAPDFDPQTYLSTLHNRHQTLEDLRSDLRARSQLLSRELLDLVNSNYEDFLGLGSTLKGGDEKVESVKVGVLGFQRQVEGVRGVVAAREREVKGLLDEKRVIRKDMLVGRKLLEIDDRLGELERRLMIQQQAAVNGDKSSANHDGDEHEYEEYDDDDDDQDEDGDGSSLSSQARPADVLVARLKKHAQLYLLLQHLVQQVGASHPFITAQQARTTHIRKTLLLDLGAALKQAKKDGRDAAPRTLRLTSIYRALGEGEELMSVLKST